jgi:hypothetical protein
MVHVNDMSGRGCNPVRLLIVPGLTTEQYRHLIGEQLGVAYVAGTVDDVALAIWKMMDDGHGNISFAYHHDERNDEYELALRLDKNNVTLDVGGLNMNLKQANAFGARWQQLVEFGRKWFDLLYPLDKVQERLREAQERAARELREAQEQAGRETIAEWHRKQGEEPPEGMGVVAPPARRREPPAVPPD